MMTKFQTVPGMKPDRTLQVAAVSTAGVFGIYLATLAGKLVLSTDLSIPSRFLLAALLMYAVVLGLWCGLRGISSDITVVISVSFTVAYAILALLAQIVNLGYTPELYLPLFALILLMILGVIQFASLIGFWVGRRVGTRDRPHTS